jgi:hypothetical protein
VRSDLVRSEAAVEPRAVALAAAERPVAKPGHRPAAVGAPARRAVDPERRVVDPEMAIAWRRAEERQRAAARLSAPAAMAPVALPAVEPALLAAAAKGAALPAAVPALPGAAQAEVVWPAVAPVSAVAWPAAGRSPLRQAPAELRLAAAAEPALGAEPAVGRAALRLEAGPDLRQAEARPVHAAGAAQAPGHPDAAAALQGAAFQALSSDADQAQAHQLEPAALAR